MKLVVFVVALLVCGSAEAFYERGSTVISLKSMKDVDAIAKSKFLWMLEIYREGCGYCQMLTPEYEKTASNLEKIVRVAAVDAEKNQDVVQALARTYNIEIKGVPTVVVLKPNAKKPEEKKERIVYNGERKAEHMTAFLRPMIPDYSESVSMKNFDTFLAKPFGKVVLFSEKKGATSLFKALSAKFHNRLHFGVVKSDAALAQLLNASSLPALFAIPADGTAADAKLYTGKPSFLSLDFFLVDYAAPKKSGSKQTPPPPPPKASTTPNPSKPSPPPPPKTEEKAEEKIDVSNPSKLSMKQLRIALKQNGGSCVGCSEKHEYVSALIDALKDTPTKEEQSSSSNKDEL